MPSAIANVGDQNGDGIDDAALSYFDETVFVVYGVSDPTTLPLCGGPAPTRCVDTTNLDETEGYRLDSTAGSFTFGASITGVGDFNGDGKDDFAIGDPQTANGNVYIVYGGLSPEGSPYDVDALTSAQALRIVGSESGGQAGTIVSGLGDMNNDGIDDVYIDQAAGAAATAYVLFGSDTRSSPLDLAVFDSSMGYRVSPPLLTILNAANAGDINGDGRPDLVLGGWGPLSIGGQGAVVYSPETISTAPISATNPSPDQGYTITPTDPNGGFGGSTEFAGDLNGDGIPDQLFGSSQLEVAGNTNAGAASIVFGRRPSPESPIKLGPDMTPQVGISLVGDAANQRAGLGSVGAGDLDGDGLPDYFVSASGAAVGATNNAGIIHLIRGSSLVPSVATGETTSVTDHGAVLSGAVSGTRGEGNARFEWGTTDAYGNETSPQPVRGTSAPAAHLTGLSPDTVYHYRLVAENGLGVARFGADKTFKTASLPVERCEQDPSLPGCPGYNFCAANPSDPVCQNRSGRKAPRLSKLIFSHKTVRVRRGKKARVAVSVVNTGNASAKGVTICAFGPRKSIKVPKCKKVGRLKAGAVASRAFKLKVKKRAHKGKKLVLKLKVKANGLGSKSARVNVRVR